MRRNCFQCRGFLAWERARSKIRVFAYRSDCVLQIRCVFRKIVSELIQDCFGFPKCCFQDWFHEVRVRSQPREVIIFRQIDSGHPAQNWSWKWFTCFRCWFSNRITYLLLILGRFMCFCGFQTFFCQDYALFWNGVSLCVQLKHPGAHNPEIY